MDKEKVNDVLKMNRLNYALQMSIIFLIFVVFIRPLNFGEDELILKLGKGGVIVVFYIYVYYIFFFRFFNIILSKWEIKNSLEALTDDELIGLFLRNWAFLAIMLVLMVLMGYSIISDYLGNPNSLGDFSKLLTILVLCITPGPNEEQQENFKQYRKQLFK